MMDCGRTLTRGEGVVGGFGTMCYNCLYATTFSDDSAKLVALVCRRWGQMTNQLIFSHYHLQREATSSPTTALIFADLLHLDMQKSALPGS